MCEVLNIAKILFVFKNTHVKTSLDLMCCFFFPPVLKGKLIKNIVLCPLLTFDYVFLKIK